MDLLAGLKQTFGRLGYAKIGAMALAAAGVLAFIAWIAVHATGPMGLLYAGLDPAEAGRIGQRLDELKVPYEAKGDGTTILVPQSEVARVRMELAAAGLPHEGGAGYELLDQQSPMNMTSFMQRVQRVRALEGELARTIVTLNGVRSARVHIVLPERETFSRETPKATASVAVVMNGPMRLSPAQAAAIRLLIAGAVPGLQQDDVSVLDPSGIVLAADGADVLASARLTDLRTSRERTMEQAVTNLLEPLVGPGKVRVVAAVDLDTERAVTHEEKFDPLSQVERSKQTQVDKETSSDSTPQQPVSVGSNLPNANPSQAGSGEKTASSSTHNGETVNYEISSVRNETVHEPGDVRRLTLAVVVDGSTDAHGAYQPRSAQELAQFTTLVQSAVGFDAKRGDKITVETLHFLPDDQGTASDVQPVATQPVWIWASIGALAVLLLAAAAIMLAMRKRYRVELARREEAVAAATTALTEETANLPALTAEQRALIPAAQQVEAQDTFLMSLFDLVDQRPDEALAVLRAWIAGVGNGA